MYASTNGSVCSILQPLISPTRRFTVCAPAMKSIVVCLDGTALTFGRGPFSNVLKLFLMLDRTNQVCYYQPGVGTSFGSDTRGFFDTQWESLKNSVDTAFAFSLEQHVREAYRVLMTHYEPGARIYVFGFSRGSFAARVLAGMVEHVGLLYPELIEMLPIAWKLYAGWEIAGQPIANDRVRYSKMFKKAFSREVRFAFMGLWDTVSSVGLLRDRIFPYLVRTTAVDHVRHALSIDERRAKYRQVLYNFPRPRESGQSVVRAWLHRITFGYKDPSSVCPDTLEVWFPGNHGDVGGGWEADAMGHRLSAVLFRWMVAEALKEGVRFRKSALVELDSTDPPISYLLFHHDMLRFGGAPEPPNRAMGNPWLPTLFWWAIEVVPFATSTEDDDGVWRLRRLPNLGRVRKMPQWANIHWSVFYRIRHVPDYNPPNLPNELGTRFMELMHCAGAAVTPELRLLCRAMDKFGVLAIRDSHSAVWDVLPDELALARGNK